jgi:hypothetical protein
MRLLSAMSSLIVVVLSSSAVCAQSLQSASSQSVPRLINITGVFRPANGQPAGPVETVTLSIYADAERGAPLWQETQTIEIDAQGRYSLLLGATRPDGIPSEVFSGEAAQWLGTVFERAGEVEGPRTRLTSVPYALRAAEAETLGGRPASDYQLAPSAGGTKHANATAADASGVSSDVVLAGTPNFLAKYVNTADVGTSGVFEAADGAIGLGTTMPFDRIHVRYNNNTGDFTGLAVQNTNPGALAYSGMLFYDHTNALTQFQGYNNATHEYRINNIAKSGGQFDGSINFMTGSTSRFFVDSNGNVGIGTTTPGAALDISTGSAVVRATSFKGGNVVPSFIGRVARGTPSSPEAVLQGDPLSLVAGIGYDGRPFAPYFPSMSNADIALIAAEHWTQDAHGTAILFSTTPLGTTLETLATMTILPSGNVTIGTPRDFATGLPIAPDKLHVFGDIRVGTTGTNGCIKDFSGTGIVGTCSSDRRLKKDITPFEPVLNQLAALQPVHYFWRTSEFPERHFGNLRADGLIAQDVERVLPQLVETESDGYKAINYGKLPLLTIEAVKELKAQNETLTAQINGLTFANEALALRIAELERLVAEMLSASRRQ